MVLLLLVLLLHLLHLLSIHEAWGDEASGLSDCTGSFATLFLPTSSTLTRMVGPRFRHSQDHNQHSSAQQMPEQIFLPAVLLTKCVLSLLSRTPVHPFTHVMFQT